MLLNFLQQWSAEDFQDLIARPSDQSRADAPGMARVDENIVHACSSQALCDRPPMHDLESSSSEFSHLSQFCSTVGKKTSAGELGRVIHILQFET